MIREIDFDDLSTIYDLGLQYDSLFRKHYSLEDYLNNDIYILKCFEDSDLIKGFVIATKMYENIEILLIFVDQKYRKQNIGFLLMKSLENITDNILLEVSMENKPAIALYKKLGYDIIGTRKKYYNGIDALIMKKVLK